MNVEQMHAAGQYIRNLGTLLSGLNLPTKLSVYYMKNIFS